jgi:hypothetical protein
MFGKQTNAQASESNEVASKRQHRNEQARAQYRRSGALDALPFTKFYLISI